MPKVRRCRYRGCHTMVVMPDQYCSQHINQARSNRSEYNRIYNATVRQRADNAVRYRFYKSKVWQSLRVNILKRDMYLCQYCKEQGRVKSGNIVDHIVPIEYDSSLRVDPDNLVTACKECHNAKTRWEHSYYGTGQNATKKKTVKIQDIKLIVRLIFK